MRINKMITLGKMPWSFIKFSQLIHEGNVWRSVWRICMWILGFKGLTKICHTNLSWDKSRHIATPPLVSPRNDDWGTYWWRITTQIWIVLLIAWRKFWTARHHGKLRCSFFTRKVSTVIFIYGIKPSPKRKMIKLLTLDNLLPPLWYSRQNPW